MGRVLSATSIFTIASRISVVTVNVRGSKPIKISFRLLSSTCVSANTSGLSSSTISQTSDSSSILLSLADEYNSSDIFIDTLSDSADEYNSSDIFIDTLSDFASAILSFSSTVGIRKEALISSMRDITPENNVRSSAAPGYNGSNSTGSFSNICPICNSAGEVLSKAIRGLDVELTDDIKFFRSRFDRDSNRY